MSLISFKIPLNYNFNDAKPFLYVKETRRRLVGRYNCCESAEINDQVEHRNRRRLRNGLLQPLKQARVENKRYTSIQKTYTKQTELYSVSKEALQEEISYTPAQK